jgi:CP family cyanate transporter-like MFS transporter
VRSTRVLVVVGIVLASLNLRPALANVSPLLAEIMADLRLSPTGGGLITTVMVLCLGIGAPAAAVAERRLGLERTLVVALATLAAGTLLRSAGGTTELYAGAAVAGCGIAVLNVIMPALVRQYFPDRIGLLTGTYVTGLSLGAALAASFTVPLEHAIGGGWRPAAAAIAPLAVLAILVWLPQLRQRHVVLPARRSIRTLLRARITWYVTGFMGLQSLTFYTSLAWLPEILRDAGLAATEAGFLLGLANLAQIATTFTMPVLASRARTQSWHVVAAAALTAIGYLGVLLAPGTATWVWAVVLGLGQGASISLALLIITLRAPDRSSVTALSSIAQSTGYVVAATGPVLVGVLRETSGGWSLPLTCVLLILVVQALLGRKAGKPLD